LKLYFELTSFKFSFIFEKDFNVGFFLGVEYVKGPFLVEKKRKAPKQHCFGAWPK
jgi:hypothetical protein